MCLFCCCDRTHEYEYSYWGENVKLQHEILPLIAKSTRIFSSVSNSAGPPVLRHTQYTRTLLFYDSHKSIKKKSLLIFLKILSQKFCATELVNQKKRKTKLEANNGLLSKFSRLLIRISCIKKKKNHCFFKSNL